MKNRHPLLFFACALFLVLFASRGWGSTRVLTAPGHPVFLVMEEDAGIVTRAFFRTPGNLQPVSEVIGLSFAAEASTASMADRDSRPDLLWKLSFLDPRNRSEGTVLWISALTRQPRAILGTSPIGETLWDAIRPRLSVPRGTLLYVSPILPAFFTIPQFQGKDVLSYVYCVTLGETGPVIGVLPDVYRQLLRVVQTVRVSESDPGKKRAYEALEKDFGSVAEGGKPSTEAILNFDFKKIAEISWRP